MNRSKFRPVAERAKRRISGLFKFGRTLWEVCKKKPKSVLAAIAGLLLVGAISLAALLRILKPYPTLIVSAFEVPSTTAFPLGVTGKTVANIVVDELQEIREKADAYAVTRGRPLLVPTRPREPSDIRIEIG